MTRKDFELIAAAIRECRGDSDMGDAALDILAETFARKLANRVAMFNYARFIEATR